MPIISLIAAMDENRLIGVENRLPWRLPRDMKRFMTITMGKPIILGRRTYESIPKRFRPLRGRQNIVLTRNPSYAAEGCTVAHTIEEAIAAAGEVEEILVGGGAQLYEEMLPQASRMYLTIIESAFSGDAYFPQFDVSEWKTVLKEVHEADEENPYRHRFEVLERRDAL